MKFERQISSRAITTTISRLDTVFAIALLLTGSLAMTVNVGLAYFATHTFLRDFPGEVENGWSEEIQGVAHDEGHWFFTQRDYLLKFPVDSDLSVRVERQNFGHSIRDYPQLDEYNHFGDLEYYQGFLFVPVEYLDEDYTSLKRAIVVFEASDLSYVDLVELTNQLDNLGWLAINHQQGLLYTSGDPHVYSLLRYRIDMGTLNSTRNLRLSLAFQDVFPLFENDGSTLWHYFEAVQGGVFSPWGDLYLVNGDSSTSYYGIGLDGGWGVKMRGGLHVFNSTGYVVAESRPWGNIDFQYDYGFWGGYEEPEGIDWWNRDSYMFPESPGIEGQLHVIVLDNDVDTDDFTLKNYRVDYVIPDYVDSDDDGFTDRDEVYKYNTDPLIAPPTGSMTIKWNGNEEKAKLPDVTLFVTSYDVMSDVWGEHPSRIRFKDENTDWAEWKPYYSVCSWTLSGDAGLKSVYCEVENKAGLVSQFSDSIEFTNAQFTSVFFNINPNPAIEHEAVGLKGIVIDKQGSPVPPTPSPPELYWGRVELSYQVGSASGWTPFKTLSVDPDGIFSTSIEESPELDLSGEIIFKAEYVAGDNYIDSKAQACLRFIMSEVRSPESSTSLYFYLWMVDTVKGWPVGLTGCLRDSMGSPESDAPVTVYFSVDDGASWEFEETKFTDAHGIFNAQIETDAFGAGAGPLGQAQPVLIRASHIIGVFGESVEIYKTAYLTVGTDWHLERLYPVVQINIPHVPIPLGAVRYLPYEIQVGLPATAAYDVRFTDTTSLRINGTLPVGSECATYRDTNGDGLLDLTLTMDRTVLSKFILSRNVTTGNVTLLLTGRFYDNVMFGGIIVVKVRMPGDINIDGKVDVKDVAVAGRAFGSYEGHPRWNPTADENEDGKIDIRDIVLICKKFGTKYT